MADISNITKLREQTGAGILECKSAWTMLKATLRKPWRLLKKGIAKAAKKDQRVTAEGRIGTYVHTNGKLGVMAELNCETDFVAKNEVFQQFLKDVCMQVAATKPVAIKREDIPSQIVEEQKRYLWKRPRKTCEHYRKDYCREDG